MPKTYKVNCLPTTNSYLSRELTDFSLPKIGEEFGGRDHTTVIHAHEKIANDIKSDPTFKQEVENLEKEIRNQ